MRSVAADLDPAVAAELDPAVAADLDPAVAAELNRRCYTTDGQPCVGVRLLRTTS
ncbi:hypothetical protein [Streptomyces sp. cmx-18-6]|uniref:hypothetical protein n=1 Tax=Streptomyces sp. cmx-18-6 TaxID=2790930 RepID=UPI0039804F69